MKKDVKRAKNLNFLLLVVEPGKPVWQQIKQNFGDEVFNADETLNREKLGQVIFDNVEKRRVLNRITHPVIHREIYKQVFKFFVQGKPFVVLELPLLFEVNSNLLNFIYKIICVVAEEDIQIARLIDRNSLTETEAKKRIKAQMSLDEKAKMSHYVIENSGSPQDMEQQALSIIRIIVDSNHHWRLRGMIFGALVSLIAGVTWLLNWRFKWF